MMMMMMEELGWRIEGGSLAVLPQSGFPKKKKTKEELKKEVRDTFDAKARVVSQEPSSSHLISFHFIPSGERGAKNPPLSHATTTTTSHTLSPRYHLTSKPALYVCVSLGEIESQTEKNEIAARVASFFFFFLFGSSLCPTGPTIHVDHGPPMCVCTP